MMLHVNLIRCNLLSRHVHRVCCYLFLFLSFSRADVGERLHDESDRVGEISSGTLGVTTIRAAQKSDRRYQEERAKEVREEFASLTEVIARSEERQMPGRKI